MLALTRDGKRAYTSNVHAGTVSAIDLATKKVLAVIPVSKMAQRIALSVDDRLVFTADQMEPRLAVIDTATNQIRQWVALPGIAYGTATTPDGRYLVMALLKNNQVGILDLQSMKVVKTARRAQGPADGGGAPRRQGRLRLLRRRAARWPRSTSRTSRSRA